MTSSYSAIQKKNTYSTSVTSFKKLPKAELKLKLSKCAFFKKELQYLGHLVSEGVCLLLEKLESIQNMPAPRNTKEVKQFLGLVGYC